MTETERAMVFYDGDNNMPYCDLVYEALKEKRDRESLERKKNARKAMKMLNRKKRHERLDIHFGFRGKRYKANSFGIAWWLIVLAYTIGILTVAYVLGATVVSVALHVASGISLL